MGQQITANELWPPPRPLTVILSCDGCEQADFSIYGGDDYIKIRKQAHEDGWRRRNNAWYRGACIPKTADKEPEEW